MLKGRNGGDVMLSVKSQDAHMSDRGGGFGHEHNATKAHHDIVEEEEVLTRAQLTRLRYINAPVEEAQLQAAQRIGACARGRLDRKHLAEQRVAATKIQSIQRARITRKTTKQKAAGGSVVDLHQLSLVRAADRLANPHRRPLGRFNAFKVAQRRQVPADSSAEGPALYGASFEIETQSVKCWPLKGGIFGPGADMQRALTVPDNTMPAKGPAVQHIYGYRGGFMHRNNVVRLNDASNEKEEGTLLLYYTGGRAIVFDIASGKQRLFAEHDNDILCLAVTHGNTVATGQLQGEDDQIIFWDHTTMRRTGSVSSEASGSHIGGVGSLAFSESGDLMVSIGLEETHNMTVWGLERDSKSGAVIAATRYQQRPIGKFEILGLSFGQDGGLVTCGEKHTTFWSFGDNPVLTCEGRPALFARHSTLDSTDVLCAVTIPLPPDEAEAAGATHVTLGGVSDGQVYVFVGRDQVHRFHGHVAGGVHCMQRCQFRGATFITAGEEGTVRLWSYNLKRHKAVLLMEVSYAAAVIPGTPLVCTSLHVLNDHLVTVGTAGCDIISIDLDDFAPEKDGKFQELAVDGEAAAAKIDGGALSSNYDADTDASVNRVLYSDALNPGECFDSLMAAGGWAGLALMVKKTKVTQDHVSPVSGRSLLHLVCQSDWTAAGVEVLEGILGEAGLIVMAKKPDVQGWLPEHVSAWCNTPAVLPLLQNWHEVGAHCGCPWPPPGLHLTLETRKKLVTPGNTSLGRVKTPAFLATSLGQIISPTEQQDMATRHGTPRGNTNCVMTSKTPLDLAKEHKNTEWVAVAKRFEDERATLEILRAKPVPTAKLLLESHSDEVNACVSHPTDPNIFATCSDDGTVRVWSCLIRRCISYRLLSGRITALDWSPNGKHITYAGMNGRSTSPNMPLEYAPDLGVLSWVEATPGSGLKHGYLATADQDPRPQARFGRHKHTPTARYSPDGQMLAVCSHDGFIDLFAVGSVEGGTGYRQISHCRGHTSFVLNVDWAKSSRVLRTQDGSNKLMYWEAPSGIGVKAAKMQKVRMVEWATDTCTVGWSVRGAHQVGMNGTDVSAVRVSPDGKMLAAVDDFGLLRLYTYPSVYLKQAHARAQSHFGGVRDVSWLSKAPHKPKVVVNLEPQDITGRTAEDLRAAGYDESKIKERMRVAQAKVKEAEQHIQHSVEKKSDKPWLLTVGGSDCSIVQWGLKPLDKDAAYRRMADGYKKKKKTGVSGGVGLEEGGNAASLQQGGEPKRECVSAAESDQSGSSEFFERPGTHVSLKAAVSLAQWSLQGYNRGPAFNPAGAEGGAKMVESPDKGPLHIECGVDVPRQSYYRDPKFDDKPVLLADAAETSRDGVYRNPYNEKKRLPGFKVKVALRLSGCAASQFQTSARQNQLASVLSLGLNVQHEWLTLDAVTEPDYSKSAEFKNDGATSGDPIKAGMSKKMKDGLVTEARRVFTLVDQDESGSVDLDELDTALEQSGTLKRLMAARERNMRLQGLGKHFKKICLSDVDTNKDGTISFEEMEAWVTKLLTELHAGGGLYKASLMTISEVRNSLQGTSITTMQHSALDDLVFPDAPPEAKKQCDARLTLWLPTGSKVQGLAQRLTECDEKNLITKVLRDQSAVFVRLTQVKSIHFRISRGRVTTSMQASQTSKHLYEHVYDEVQLSDLKGGAAGATGSRTARAVGAGPIAQSGPKPIGNVKQAKLMSEAKRVWNSVDENGDGNLTIGEINSALEKSGTFKRLMDARERNYRVKGMHSEYKSLTLSDIDINDDGVITFEEMEAFVMGVLTELHEGGGLYKPGMETTQHNKEQRKSDEERKYFETHSTLPRLTNQKGQSKTARAPVKSQSKTGGLPGLKPSPPAGPNQGGLLFRSESPFHAHTRVSLSRLGLNDVKSKTDSHQSVAVMKASKVHEHNYIKERVKLSESHGGGADIHQKARVDDGDLQKRVQVN